MGRSSGAQGPSLRASLLLSLTFLFGGADAAATRNYPPTNLAPILRHPDRRWSAGTYVSFPGSDEFVESTERWTTFSAPTYRAAISPANEEDVAKIVCKRKEKKMKRPS